MRYNSGLKILTFIVFFSSTSVFCQVNDGDALGVVVDVSPEISVGDGLSMLPNYCDDSIANRIAREYSKKVTDLRGNVHVWIFNQSGRLCATNAFNQDISEKDLLVVAYPDSKESIFYVNPKSCSVIGDEFRIADNYLDISKESSSDLKFIPGLRYDFFRCYGDGVALEFKKTSDDSITQTLSFAQKLRYRATWQVGAVWTDMVDHQYIARDVDGKSIIAVDQTDEKGPEYVASLTVYGLPYYLKMFGDESATYGGRDIINHNAWQDRVGLNFQIGIDEPKDTLGVGLAFEIVSGVSITYSMLYRKLDMLDGVYLGDEFDSGNAIPTVKSWESDAVWGLSIDGKYLAKFFGGGN